LLKNRQSASDVCLVAANQCEQLALLCGARAAPDRSLDEIGFSLLHCGAERLHRVGADRAHVYHELSGKPALENTIRTAIDCLACGIVEQHHDHDLAPIDQCGWRAEQLCSRVGQRPGFRSIAVPHADVMSKPDQSPCDR
jgi:hypothetical protein